MFKIDPNPRFTHEVTARVPVDGGFDDQAFKVTYRVMPSDEVASIDMTEQGSMVAFLKKAVVGLDDITGADGKPLPYSDAVRDQLIGVPYAARAMTRGYFEAVYQAQLGN